MPSTSRTLLVFPLLLLSAAALAPSRSQAPDRALEGIVSGEGFTAVRIAVPEADSPDLELAREAIATVRRDLEYSGLFEVVDPSLYRLVGEAPDEGIRHEDWVAIGADFLLTTRVRSDGDRLDLEARLHDNGGPSTLMAKRYGGRPDIWLAVAHRLSDDVVGHFTGRPGVAQTRIAFVSEHGDGKEIYLMDYDGRRVRRLTTSGTINLAPTWSPDGDELAFASWRGRQPGVYVMSSEGEMREVRTVGGEFSGSPDWSPDGSRLVYTSDVDGNAELYVARRATGRNQRLTFNPAIDTAPAFSPNGREIAFTSDRSGTPQIYVMDAEGLNVRRVSWDGSYNESAAWSPRGDRLAYASRIEGRFQIVVLDLAGGRTTQLTRASANHENPRWSPDGRHLVFASDRDGGYQIYTMRADGSRVSQLTRGRDSFTPDWSR